MPWICDFQDKQVSRKNGTLLPHLIIHFFFLDIHKIVKKNHTNKKPSSSCITQLLITTMQRQAALCFSFWYFSDTSTMPLSYQIQTFETWLIIWAEMWLSSWHPLSWGDKAAECWERKCTGTSHTRGSCSSLTSVQCLCQCCSCLLFSDMTALWGIPKGNKISKT